MDSEVNVCAECTLTCLLLHGGKTPAVTSFFKIMIGDHYSKFMYLPPDFEPVASDLVNKKIPLKVKDLKGQQWQVKLSKLNGRIAFQQGWNRFSSDHMLQIGDFLQFDYIKGSHFIVRIYNRTGCESLNFLTKSSQKKKAKCCDVNYAIDECPMNNTVASEVDVVDKGMNGITTGTENSFRTSDLVAKKECDEEPFLMLDRDFGGKREEEMRPLFDLSCFEMLNGNAAIRKSDEENAIGDKINICPANVSPIKAILVEKDSVGEASDVEMKEKANDLSKADSNVASVTGDISSSNSKNSEQSKSTSEMDGVMGTREHHASATSTNQTDHIKVAKELEESVIPITTKVPNRQGLRESLMKVKEEHIEIDMTEDPRGETLDLVPFYSFTSTISCVIPSNNQPFLELPMSLPTYGYKGKTKMGRMVVYLRDPCMRLWPIFYQEQSGVNKLMSGWAAFSEANDIKPGDECIFGVESESNGMFKVDIVRK